MREEKPRAFNSLAEAMAKIQEREARHADPGRLSDEVRERIEKAVELVRARRDDGYSTGSGENIAALPLGQSRKDDAKRGSKPQRAQPPGRLIPRSHDPR